MLININFRSQQSKDKVVESNLSASFVIESSSRISRMKKAISGIKPKMVVFFEHLPLKKGFESIKSFVRSRFTKSHCKKLVLSSLFFGLFYTVNFESASALEMTDQTAKELCDESRETCGQIAKFCKIKSKTCRNLGKFCEGKEFNFGRSKTNKKIIDQLLTTNFELSQENVKLAETLYRNSTSFYSCLRTSIQNPSAAGISWLIVMLFLINTNLRQVVNEPHVLKLAENYKIVKYIHKPIFLTSNAIYNFPIVATKAGGKLIYRSYTFFNDYFFNPKKPSAFIIASPEISTTIATLSILIDIILLGFLIYTAYSFNKKIDFNKKPALKSAEN